MVKIQSHLLAFILEIIVSYVHRAIPAFDAQTCQSQNLVQETSTRKPYIWGENL